MVAPWKHVQAHIRELVRTEGQALLLLDEDGGFIGDMPHPISMKAGVTRNGVGTLEVTTLARGVVCPATLPVTELVGDALGRTDAEGRLVPVTNTPRLLLLARRDHRSAYVVTHVDVEDGVQSPAQITTHAVHVVDYLAAWPAPSVPVSWGKHTMKARRRDEAVEWSRSFDVAPVELATTADGYTLKGKAIHVIRTLVEDSVAAVNGRYGWVDPHLVVDWSPVADEGPETLIRVTDGTVWETIQEPAANAGVTLDVDLWLPGDPPVVRKRGVLEGFDAMPTLVLRTRLTKEVT